MSPLAKRLSWIESPFNARWPIVIPIGLLLTASLIFRYTNLDLSVSSLFYDQQTETWPYFYSIWCTCFYRGGTYPAVLLVTLGGILTLIGAIIRRRRDWLKAGIFLLAVFGIGPGLIVNAGFKPNWGRPRPHQLEQFGGTHEFAAIGSPGELDNHNSSFPSGHAAVAFYLIAPAFLVRGRSPRLANLMLALGLAFGTGMSATRVMQGGHFASDVMWSAGIVYLTCVGLARLILFPRIAPSEAIARPAHGTRRTWCS